MAQELRRIRQPQFIGSNLFLFKIIVLILSLLLLFFDQCPLKQLSIGFDNSKGLNSFAFAARYKGLIYNKDGRFIYRPPRSNQGHIIVIDDRYPTITANSSSNSNKNNQQQQSNAEPNYQQDNKQLSSSFDGYANFQATSSHLMPLSNQSSGSVFHLINSHPNLHERSQFKTILPAAAATGVGSPIQLISLADQSNVVNNQQPVFGIESRISSLQQPTLVGSATKVHEQQAAAAAAVQLIPIVQLFPSSQAYRISPAAQQQQQQLQQLQRQHLIGFNLQSAPTHYGSSIYGSGGSGTGGTVEPSASYVATHPNMMELAFNTREDSPSHQQFILDQAQTANGYLHQHPSPPSSSSSIAAAAIAMGRQRGLTPISMFGDDPQSSSQFEQHISSYDSIFSPNSPSSSASQSMGISFDEPMPPPPSPPPSHHRQLSASRREGGGGGSGGGFRGRTRLSSIEHRPPPPVHDLDDVEGDHVEFYDTDSQPPPPPWGRGSSSTSVATGPAKQGSGGSGAHLSEQDQAPAQRGLHNSGKYPTIKAPPGIDVASSLPLTSSSGSGSGGVGVGSGGRLSNSGQLSSSTRLQSISSDGPSFISPPALNSNSHQNSDNNKESRQINKHNQLQANGKFNISTRNKQQQNSKLSEQLRARSMPSQHTMAVNKHEQPQPMKLAQPSHGSDGDNNNNPGNNPAIEGPNSVKDQRSSQYWRQFQDQYDIM